MKQVCEHSGGHWPNGPEPIFVDYFVEVGIAKGAFDLASRGTGLRVTCWSNPRNQLRPLPWNHVRGMPMWNQEMYILAQQSTPEISKLMEQEAARTHWQKLWDRLQEIPEEQAIGEEQDVTPAARIDRAKVRRAIWSKAPKANEYSSVFCTSDEHARCKQIDCDCKCHLQAVNQVSGETP